MESILIDIPHEKRSFNRNHINESETLSIFARADMRELKHSAIVIKWIN